MKKKPSWSNAPKWAIALAQDETGLWFWYEKTPIMQRSRFVDEKEFLGGNGRVKFAGNSSPRNWHKSREKRPEEVR